MFETVRMVAWVLGMIISIGGVVFGNIAFIRKNKKEAQAAAKKYSDALLLEMEARYKTEREAIMTQFQAVIDLSKTDVKLIFTRLNDVDLWRKEINGQLKLIGQQSEFTNRILEGHVRHLETIATVTQSLTVSLAEIKGIVLKSSHASCALNTHE